MQKWTLGIVAIAALTLGNLAHANLVLNPSFEVPTLGLSDFNASVSFTSGTEPANFAWKAASGSLDVVHARNDFASNAKDGSNFLDMDGFHPGAIYQDIPTIPGGPYDLQFWYSNNKGTSLGATVNPSATVRVINIASSADLRPTFTFSHNTNIGDLSSFSDPHWTDSGLLHFVATGNTTRILFTSLDPFASNGGILLDAVGVNVVPEPGAMSLAAFAVAPLLFRRRR